MFVKRLQKDNPKFIDAMVHLQQAGQLLPDSYAVDMERFRANGKAMIESMIKGLTTEEITVTFK